MNLNTNDKHSGLFKVSNYRSFLNDYLAAKKAQNSVWSIGMWAKKLGLKGTSSLSMVLNGTRNPGPDMITKFCNYFEFSDNEKKYFQNLVRLEKIKKDPELKSLIVEKLIGLHPEGEFRTLNFKNFEAISKWYFYLLRELVAIEDFREDADWISKIALFKLTPREVKNAIQTLIELEIIKRDELGQITQNDDHLDTPNDFSNEALKRFHEQMIDFGKDSLRKVDPKQREVRGMTLNISLNKLTKAKELIRKFEDEFAAIMEASDDADEVYQMNIQFFPLTQIQKVKGNSYEN